MTTAAGTAPPEPARPLTRVARWAPLVVLLALVGHAVVLVAWPDAHVLLIDLQVYRAGGEYVLAGRPLYDGGVLLDLPFVYPPFAAVLFAPLSVLPVPLLKVLWTVLNLVLLGVVAHRCARCAGVASGPVPTGAVVVVVALATWLDPVRTTLYLGQINIVVLALVVGDVLGRPGSRWRGVGVGLAAALKLTPLLFVVYLLVVGRIRAAVTATAVFVAALALGFVLDPANSATYWLHGTFATADRISDVATSANHSLNGLLARGWGAGPVVTAGFLAGAAVLGGATLVAARRAHRDGDELLGLTLCGLASAALAPFAWSHHWVWFVPLVVWSGLRALGGSRRAAVLLAGVLVSTAAVITARPGPVVGPIPSTGSISLFPDAYLLAFVVVLGAVLVAAHRRGRPRV